MCHIRLQTFTLARKCEISNWLPCEVDEGGWMDIQSDE